MPTKRIVSLRAQSDSWGKHRQGNANFTKAIFRPIKLLKLIVRWFLERSANFYLVLSRKNKGIFCSLGMSPLQYSVRTSQELDFRLITTSKNNFTEIHISRPTPLDSLSVSLLFIALSYHCHSEIMTVLWGVCNLWVFQANPGRKLTFSKPFGTVNRHREKNWPIAERLVPSNDSRNNIVGRISGPVPFLFLKWRMVFKPQPF